MHRPGPGQVRDLLVAGERGVGADAQRQPERQDSVAYGQQVPVREWLPLSINRDQNFLATLPPGEYRVRSGPCGSAQSILCAGAMDLNALLHAFAVQVVGLIRDQDVLRGRSAVGLRRDGGGDGQARHGEDRR